MLGIMPMKRFVGMRKLAVAAGLALFVTAGLNRALAQMPSTGGGANAMNAALNKLFGANTAFSAHAEFRVLDKSQKEVNFLPMNYEYLDGKTRVEMDLNQIKSSQGPAQYLPNLRQFGMDLNYVITRPDQKVTISIYPKAKSYAQIPMSSDEKTALERTYTLEKTSLGKETIDGHACDKQKITLTSDKGEKAEATVWSATDLKDFPLQLQMPTDPTGSVLIKFKDVKLSKPDAKQFEAPTTMTKYDSAEALLDALVKAQSAAKK